MVADTAAAAEPSVAAGAVGSGRRLRRNLAALATGQMVTWTMSLIWTLVVPRALGPAGMGLIVAAWSVTGILGVVLGLGTRNYLVRELVVAPDGAPQLLGTAVVLRVVLCPVFLAAVFVYSRFAGYDHEGTVVLYLAAAATIFTLIAEPLLAGFQAIERMKYLAYSDVINKSAQGLLGVALVLVGFRAVGITACWAIVAGVLIALDAWWLRPYLRVDLRTSAARMIGMVKQSVAYWAFGLFFMIYLWIDAAMLSLMTRPEVVGWYGVPTKLFQSMMFLPVVVSTAWLPRLVNAFGESPRTLRQAARHPLELVVVLSLPLAAGTAIVARPLIDTLYGPAYANAVPVLVILGLCLPPMYLNIMLNQVLVAAKRQVAWTFAMAGATVVNPLLNLALIPATASRYDNGAIGAALSLLLTELLIVTFGFFMVGREVFDRRVVRRFIVAAAASAAMWFVAYETRRLGSLPAFALGILVFFFLAAVLRLATRDELAFVRARLERFGPRRRAASDAEA